MLLFYVHLAAKEFVLVCLLLGKFGTGRVVSTAPKMTAKRLIGWAREEFEEANKWTTYNEFILLNTFSNFYKTNGLMLSY